MRPLLIGLSAVLLSACVSPAEIEARQAALDEAECVKLGFTPGTEGFGNCRLQLRILRAQESGAAAARSNNAMQTQQNIHRMMGLQK